jgi:predicted acylesterase/phospholipase RssA
MPIAYAGRISMSFPVAFAPCTMDISRFGGEYGTKENEHAGEVLTLLDGGIGSNSPIEVFVNCGNDATPIETSLQQQRSLMCVFDNNGNAYRSDSSHDGFGEHYGAATPIVNSITRAHMNENSRAENNRLNGFGGIIPVAHGRLGTLDFDENGPKVAEAEMMSEAWTKQWMAQHENSHIEVSILTNEELNTTNRDIISEKMADVARNLTDDELEATVNEHLNDGNQPEVNDKNSEYTQIFVGMCLIELTHRRGNENLREPHKQYLIDVGEMDGVPTPLTPLPLPTTPVTLT